MAEPQWILLVTAYVDPSVEADWNRWYDAVHVPEILACPGVHRAIRSVSSSPTSRWWASSRGPSTIRRKRFDLVLSL